MSSSDSDRSEHELSYYSKDKVKLMKETLKIIKPRKIKAMAPDCIKHLDIPEINSMLLEELLGISNKRLTYIFNGDDVDRETSSSESEEENIDVISLDDISDDDNDFELCNNSSKQNISELSKKGKSTKRKAEILNSVKIEKEKTKKNTIASTKPDIDHETEKSRLMSVLELLELQARARAIRSQLAIETENSKNNRTALENIKKEDSDSDAIIIDSPRNNEIIITSESDFESEQTMDGDLRKTLSPQVLELEKIKINIHSETEIKRKKEKLLSKLQKIKLVRHKSNAKEISNIKTITQPYNTLHMTLINPNEIKLDTPLNETILNDKIEAKKSSSTKHSDVETVLENINCCDNDEIVINLDEDEMDSMENA